MKYTKKIEPRQVLLFLIFFVMVFQLDSQRNGQLSSYSIDELNGQIQRIFDSAGIPPERWGLLVQTENGQVLCSHNAERPFMPASNLKIFTTGAALVKLSPDFHYVTRIYYKGHVDSKGVLQGDIRVRTSGDPTLSGGFYKGGIMQVLRAWADTVAKSGIKKIRGRLIADNSYPKGRKNNLGQLHGPSEEMGVTEAVPSPFENKHSIAKGGFVIGIPTAFAQTLVYQPTYARVIQVASRQTVTKKQGGTHKAKKAKKVKKLRRSKISAKTKISSSKKSLKKRSHHLSKRERRQHLRKRGHARTMIQQSPDLFAASAFRVALSQKGISVTQGLVKIDNIRDPAVNSLDGWKLLATYQSPSLADIVKFTNKNSQNFYADQILKTLGARVEGEWSIKKGSEVVQNFLKEIGANPSDFVMVDGSGLSKANLASPQQIVRVLQFMRKYPQFLDSFPIAGIDGSLKNRMRTSIALGSVYAKTGTLFNAKSLSGYIRTINGKNLIFSILVNNFRVPMSRVTEAEDKLCETLVVLQL